MGRFLILKIITIFSFVVSALAAQNVELDQQAVSEPPSSFHQTQVKNFFKEVVPKTDEIKLLPFVLPIPSFMSKVEKISNIFPLVFISKSDQPHYLLVEEKILPSVFYWLQEDKENIRKIDFTSYFAYFLKVFLEIYYTQNLSMNLKQSAVDCYLNSLFRIEAPGKIEMKSIEEIKSIRKALSAEIKDYFGKLIHKVDKISPLENKHYSPIKKEFLKKISETLSKKKLKKNLKPLFEDAFILELRNSFISEKSNILSSSMKIKTINKTKFSILLLKIRNKVSDKLSPVIDHLYEKFIKQHLFDLIEELEKKQKSLKKETNGDIQEDLNSFFLKDQHYQNENSLEGTVYKAPISLSFQTSREPIPFFDKITYDCFLFPFKTGEDPSFILADSAFKIFSSKDNLKKIVISY